MFKLSGLFSLSKNLKYGNENHFTMLFIFCLLMIYLQVPCKISILLFFAEILISLQINVMHTLNLPVARQQLTHAIMLRCIGEITAAFHVQVCLLCIAITLYTEY